jgi:hypothetical protein
VVGVVGAEDLGGEHERGVVDRVGAAGVAVGGGRELVARGRAERGQSSPTAA